jgi:hypothetical protein
VPGRHVEVLHGIGPVPDGFIGLPPDGTGKKLRTKDRGAGGHDQMVSLAGAETWTAYVDAVVLAQNKHHLTVFNGDATKVVRVRKLFAVNLQSAAVTGVWCRFDVKFATASSAGTTVTPVSMDSANVALPAGVVVRTNATVTDGALLYPWVTTTDEETVVPGLSKALFQQSMNIIPESGEMQEPVLRQGQGLTVKQITAATVGSYGWLAVFTVE